MTVRPTRHGRSRAEAALVALPMLLSAPAVTAQTCTVAATSAAFGQYSPTSGISDDTTATITAACQASVPTTVVISVELSAGSSGNFTSRQLQAASSSLFYQIFEDAARTAIWGDGSAGTAIATLRLTATSLPVSAGLTAFARIPAGQIVAPGSYADNVLLTVSY